MGIINSKTRKKQKTELMKIPNYDKKIPEEGELFSLNGFETRARVVKVVDGDSLHLLFEFRGAYDIWKCRIYGIDTPELRGGTEETKFEAQKAKEFVTNKLLNQIVTVYCKDFDSFGRLLVIIEFQGEDVGETLIKLGYAKPFLT